MSRRYTAREDKEIFREIDLHGDDIDVEALARKIHRTPASVNSRIRTLQTQNKVANMSAEEVKLLKEKVKPYVDAHKKIPWQDIADFYFYRPRRDPEVLRRKWRMTRNQYSSDSSSSSSSAEMSTMSSEVESDDLGLPKPDFTGFSDDSDSQLDIPNAQRIASPLFDPPSRTQQAPSHPHNNVPASARPEPVPFEPEHVSDDEHAPNTEPRRTFEQQVNSENGFILNFSKSNKIQIPQIMIILPDN